MNKRQAKKQFKKKYGYNPPKYTKTKIDWDEVNSGIIKNVSEFADYVDKEFTDAVNELCKQLQELAIGLNEVRNDKHKR